MTVKQRAEECVRRLEKYYPDAACSLCSENALQLLIATRLSAQCTDARVNTVTPALFKKYPTAKSFAKAKLSDVEKIIHPCGLYHTKAKSIIDMCVMIDEKFGGEVPDNMDDLLKLPGIGRKTANLIMGDIYGQPAVVCDTHCIRITNRLGLSKGTDPGKVEVQLKKILPPEKSNAFCHRLVVFGREICSARGPKCKECPLEDICPFKNKNK